jgi:hypothetical protein
MTPCTVLQSLQKRLGGLEREITRLKAAAAKENTATIATTTITTTTATTTTATTTATTTTTTATTTTVGEGDSAAVGESAVAQTITEINVDGEVKEDVKEVMETEEGVKGVKGVVEEHEEEVVDAAKTTLFRGGLHGNQCFLGFSFGTVDLCSARTAETTTSPGKERLPLKAQTPQGKTSTAKKFAGFASSTNTNIKGAVTRMFNPRRGSFLDRTKSSDKPKLNKASTAPAAATSSPVSTTSDLVSFAEGPENILEPTPAAEAAKGGTESEEHGGTVGEAGTRSVRAMSGEDTEWDEYVQANKLRLAQHQHTQRATESQEGEEEEDNQEAPVWIPDNFSLQCGDCAGAFSWRKRRHHCRGCGSLFCAACVNKKIAIPHLGYHNKVLA